MPDFSLVPVDHQPDFSDVSLIPVDHDPFGADGAIQQAGTQLAQTQNQSAQPQPVATPTPVQSKDDCISKCVELALPTTDYGIGFQRCMLACMSGGSSGFRRWDRHF
jgi:hypothetical protein